MASTYKAIAAPPPSAFVSEFHCWDDCGCRHDIGLCCYGLFCPWCLWAEMIAILEEPLVCCCCCSRPGCLAAFFCVEVTRCLEGLLQLSYLAAFPLSAAYLDCLLRLTPFVTARSRAALGRKHGLPTHADCFHPWCAHFFCLYCALYQEAVFIKHVLGRDFGCCFYHCCATLCLCCGRNPDPGFFRLPLAEESPTVISPVLAAAPHAWAVARGHRAGLDAAGRPLNSA